MNSFFLKCDRGHSFLFVIAGDYDMSFAIWGVGNRGKVIFDYLAQYVSVFVDNNEELVGHSYHNVPIVNYETYKDLFSDDVLVVSPYADDEIVTRLVNDNVFHFFLSNDCPSDFVEKYNPELLDLLLSKTDFSKKQVVYGYSLFGVLLYFNLLKHCEQVYLYAPENINEELIKRVNHIFGSDINLYTTNYDLDYSHSDIYNVSKYVNCNEIPKGIDSEVIEAFFVYELLAKYQNNNIKKYYNIHKNDRCFVVATGPSVTTDDLNKLNEKNEICISMNKIFYSYDETEWRADYYVGEDINLLNYYRNELIENITVPAFISDLPKDEKKWPDNFNIVHLSVNQKKSRYYGCSDFSKGYVCGLSVIFGCINLAVYMGFKEIYIIGADLNYSSDMKSSQNHFYGDKDILKANLPFNYSEVLRSYKGIDEYCKSKGVHLYNATRGGRLEILERVDLDLVLSE